MTEQIIEVEVTAIPVNITVEPVVAAVEVAVEGVPGPRGPVGPAGDGGYQHVQLNPAAQWTIPHMLGRSLNPTVLLDDIPGIPVWTAIEHPDENHTLVILPEPHSGVANF